MKLRNKHTGEIVECENIVFTHCNALALDWEQYNPNVNSLAELNADWEDVEPLIKEQEVRDAVKLWAKANLIPHNANSIEYQLADTLEGTFSEFWCNSLHIVFWSNVAPNAIHGKCYSIDELCGEEE